MSSTPPVMKELNVFDTGWPIWPSAVNPACEHDTSLTAAWIPASSIITFGATLTVPIDCTSVHAEFPVVIKVYWNIVVWLTVTVGFPEIVTWFAPGPRPKTRPVGKVSNGFAFGTKFTPVAPPPKV